MGTFASRLVFLSLRLRVSIGVVIRHLYYLELTNLQEIVLLSLVLRWRMWIFSCSFSIIMHTSFVKLFLCYNLSRINSSSESPTVLHLHTIFYLPATF
jgi:hypothetical protein